MADPTHITDIRKEATGESHQDGQYAYTVKGVVHGEARSFRLDAGTFERLEREGRDTVQKVLKETLERMHER